MINFKLQRLPACRAMCAVVLAASTGTILSAQGAPNPEQGRLDAHATPPTSRGPTGLHPLGLGPDRDGVRYVPARYKPDRPMPLVLALHGAGGAGARAITRLVPLADSLGFIVVAPDSRFATWDIVRGGFGFDVLFIGEALRQTFARYNIDTTHMAIVGFSDGASYALSLGQMNGDLFTNIIAFSPGFQSVIKAYGRPRIYVAHGTRDEILNIDRTSRVMVPKLKAQGYSVDYHEFDGTHSWSPDVVHDALVWFIK
ncbi:MAG: alpha/beta hydrolase-fold protein [bacterium]